MPELSRRRAIQLAAGGSGIILAGCSGESGSSGENSGEATGMLGGGSSNGSGSGNASNSGGSSGPTFVSYTHEVPKQIQFNEYNAQGVNRYTSATIFAWGANNCGDPVAVVPMLAKDWSLDGQTFTINLNDSFSWHNGKPFTAKDYALHFKLDRHMSAGVHYPVWNYAESVEATGKHTLEIDLSTDVNEQVLVSTVFGYRLMKDPKTFRPYLERFQDASSDKKAESIRTELAEMTIQEPIGAGPLQFVRKNNQTMVLEPYEDFPWEQLQQQFSNVANVDVSNWPTGLNMSQVNFRFSESYNQAAQYIRGNVADGGYVQNVTADSLPPQVKMVNAPSLYGIGINFNFWENGSPAGDPAFRDPNVRKAFAHIIDRQSVGTQYQGQQATTDSLMTGMLDVQENQWLDKGFRNQLSRYETDTDRAAQYLRASDYTKEDGKWYRPNGEQFTTSLATAAGVSYYVSGFEVVASQLSEFGIEAELQTQSNTSFFGSAANELGAQLTTPGYYGGQDPNPYFAFDFMYRRPVVQPAGSDEPDYNLPGDETMKVPPVGESDSDERITIDPYAKLTELGKTNDEAKQRQIVKELAWATNQWIPKITCAEYINKYVISTDDWNFPPPNSAALNMALSSSSMQWQFGVVESKSQ